MGIVVGPNNYTITDMTYWGMVEAFQNSMGTALRATPYTKFDDNSTLGTSINERYPVEFGYNLGITATVQNDIIQRILTVSVQPDPTLPNCSASYVYYGFGMLDSSYYLAANNPDEFWKRYVTQNTIIQLGNSNNQNVINRMELALPNSIGNPTQPFSGVQAMNQIGATFANMGLTSDARYGQKYLAISPSAAASMQSNYALNVFDPQFIDPILKDNPNNLGRYAGIDVYMDQQVKVHQTGSWFTTAPEITAVANTGDITQPFSTITLSGCVNGATVPAGELLYFTPTATDTGAFQAVNRSTYFPIPNMPRTVVVQQAATVSGTGTVSLNVNVLVGPGSYPTNQYTNISQVPVATNFVQVVGTAGSVYVKNFCWVKSAVLYGNPPLWPTPIGTGKGGNAVPSGIQGFPFQANVNESLENGMRLAFNMTAQGDILTTQTDYVFRTIAATNTYEDYGFTYLTSM